MSAATVGMRTRGQPGVTRVLAAAVGVATACVVPVFLVGGLGVQLQEELGFGAAALGLATAGFFAIAGLASRGMGWLVERIGARVAMRVAAALSSTCLLGLSFANGLGWMLVLLWIAGLGAALAQPSSNLLLTQGIPVDRRGMGFGVKQSAIPAATMLAGLAVPVVALTIGWRWAFVFGAVIGVLAAAFVPRVDQPELSDEGNEPARHAENRRALLLISIAGGLGSGAANAFAAFLTTAAVRVGFSPGTAGLILSLASVLGLSVRLLAGVAADRWNPNLLRVITAMLLGGSIGFALIAVPAQPVFLVGVAIGFALGWSWPGLLNFAVAKSAPGRVASATSFTQSGIYLGACFGPLLFGFLVEHVGLRGAWFAAAAGAVLAAILLLFARPRTQQSGLFATPP